MLLDQNPDRIPIRSRIQDIKYQCGSMRIRIHNFELFFMFALLNKLYA
jgi:hypothetical protein